jgi:putative membrane protein
MIILSTLPAFLGHFALGILLLVAAVTVHMRLTPHDELALIRSGNAGAAVTLGGVVIGYALPIGSAISHSLGVLDAAVWSVVAVIAQQAAFLVCTRVLLPDWRAALEERGEMAGSVLKAAAAVGVGVLNAACLTT